jgi:hypothetical protein
MSDISRSGIMDTKILNTMAHLVYRIGIFTTAPVALDDRFIWRQDQDELGEPVVWLDLEGVVHVDVNELTTEYDTVRYNAVIGWCVINRVECILHSTDATRKAWRPEP